MGASKHTTTKDKGRVTNENVKHVILYANSKIMDPSKILRIVHEKNFTTTNCTDLTALAKSMTSFVYSVSSWENPSPVIVEAKSLDEIIKTVAQVPDAIGEDAHVRITNKSVTYSSKNEDGELVQACTFHFPDTTLARLVLAGVCFRKKE